MACMIQFAPLMAMAATPLTRAVRYDDASTRQLDGITRHGPVRMNWVAVTDGNGNQRLQMKWTPSADDR